MLSYPEMGPDNPSPYLSRSFTLQSLPTLTTPFHWALEIAEVCLLISFSPPSYVSGSETVLSLGLFITAIRRPLSNFKPLETFPQHG
jgi:hypothetical protein